MEYGTKLSPAEGERGHETHKYSFIMEKFHVGKSIKRFRLISLRLKIIIYNFNAN